MHKIIVTDRSAQKGDLNSVGGFPILAKSQEHPKCKICDAKMALFLQLDLKPEFATGFLPGSHLLAFMCPAHNDCSMSDASSYDSTLPEAFWEQEEGHFALILNPPNIEETIGDCDPYIQAKQLDFVAAEEAIENLDEDFTTGSDTGFKVGGTASWFNNECKANCCCGAKLQFIGQIPDSFEFAQTATAPKQPNGFSSTDYCFLLGNQVYIMACSAQCDARAVMAICDN
jgi:hypothetical protein